jgi:glycosyltransferase involved in cell wall biosynthesis
MRVLQLHTRYRETGGEDAVVEAERSALASAGHDVEQHIEENPTTALGAATALAGSVWNVSAARRVGATVEKFQPDVVHVHNTWFALSPSVLSGLRRRRVPVVMTVHNYRLACANALFLREDRPCEECVDHGVRRAIQHRCYRGGRATSAVAAAGIAMHSRLGTWVRFVDRFIVLSAFARNRMNRIGLPADRMLLGSNFVDDPGPRPRPPAASREVLFVGRISPEKGLHVLLAAWRSSAVGDLRLVVVGDGAARAELQAQAPANVEFTGRLPRDAVRERLQNARALVLPSTWYEGQPIVALEGAASGTPLVLSDIGGLPEVVGDTGSGWLSPPGRPDALGRTLARLTEHAEVNTRGAAARRRFESTFTAAAAVARLEDVYRGAVHQ